jgi:hypothetical protein
VALMRTVQDIYFDVTGQTLYIDAPEGRPSSVTSVEVFPWDASDDAASEWTATPTVETNPNTTCDAASGYGLSDPRLIYVAATTGFAIDRSYLITGADGFKEWFVVEEVDSGNSITARHPLHNAYASADTVQSTRITASVDATWVADSGNLRDDTGPNPHYRVRWVYVVGGVTYVHDSYFNLVRYAGTHGVLPQNIESLAAGWLDTLPTDHRENQGRTLISDAYVAVKLDLHSVWTDDSMMANTEVVDELVRYKTIELGEFAKIMAGGGDISRHQLAAQSYQRRFDSLSRITNKTPIRDSSGAAQEKPALSLSRR